MVRIITDSAADLQPQEYERLGVFCIPLRVAFGDAEYLNFFDAAAPLVTAESVDMDLLNINVVNKIDADNITPKFVQEQLLLHVQ